MKPSRSSPHRRPPIVQLSLPLQASRITALDIPDRAGVIALLARLLRCMSGASRVVHSIGALVSSADPASSAEKSFLLLQSSGRRPPMTCDPRPPTA